MSRRAASFIAAAVVAVPLFLAGGVATATPPVPTVPELTTCAEDSKKVGTFKTVSATAWEVTISGRLPLCTPIYAQAVNWKYDVPPAKWPQTRVKTGEVVKIQEPGTYLVGVPKREHCGQSDGYARKGKAPKVPDKLTDPNDPNQPRFLQDFFTATDGKPAWSYDDPKKCRKPAEVEIDAAGCVDGDDGKVTVKVTNPNKYKVNYMVKLGKTLDQTKPVDGGASVEFVFSGLTVGEYKIVVLGSNRTKVAAKAKLEECPPPSSTTTVPPSSTSSSSVPPPTSTSLPTSSASPIPAGGNKPDLAETGASIGVPLGIGALLLVGGALLFFATRHRKANN